MPIYEYRCPKCGDFDQMQKITEAPLKKCPTCKSKVTKLLSNPAFHLKGGGWYITDYGRKGGDGKGSEGGSSEAKSDDSASSGDSKSDSKSETKAGKKEKKADKKATSASAAA
jgi:putative FmdB family regulatory protein